MTRTALPLALALLSTGCATGGMVTGFSRPTSGHGELAIDPIDAEPVDMPVGTGPEGEEEVYFELTEIASQHPHTFTVEIEAETGVPSTASVDWHEAAIDDWMQLQVELVRPQALDMGL